MAALFSTDAQIWLAAIVPPLMIGGLAFTIAHVVEVLFPSFGEEA